MRNSVKICHAALDEWNGSNIVLRGVVHPDSYHHLKVDEYQREVRPLSSLQKLMSAYQSHARVPDIELGCRGEDFVERDGCFYLQDPVYIIDGLQRISAAVQGLSTGFLTEPPHLGCMVHFGSTEPWERDRFRILNTKRDKVSPNVLLRNMRADSDVVTMLFNLCMDGSFAMKNRVSWAQNKARGELLTAKTFLGVVGRLHAHAGAGRASRVDDLVVGLEQIMKAVGRNKMRENVMAFFEFVDAAYGIRHISYAERAVQVKQNFLFTLALLVSDHVNFWKDTEGKVLQIKAPDRRKLAQFPINDPSVRDLGGGNQQAGRLLYGMLQEHYNSGKRNGHLKPRARPTFTGFEAPEEFDRILQALRNL